MKKVNNLGVLLIWFTVSLSAENCDESDKANIIIEDGNIEPGQTKLFDTGLSLTVPEGTYGRIAPRSGLSKKGLLVNAGVIDRDYTGPVKIMLHNLTNETYIISKKDRIAQLILEKIELSDIKLVDSLVTTDRGEGGFGSTGK